MDKRLRDELVTLIGEDDAVRDELARDGALFEGYHPRMENIHHRNSARLAEIIGAVGWPTRTLVGNEGASAAWRIVQHAIGNPEFMRSCMPILRQAVERGEGSAAQLAMLEDRIRVFEGRPQIYGTQFDWDESLTAMVPMGEIENPNRLEERRRRAGLPPMQWRRSAPSDEPMPARSNAERRLEMENWAKRVGWRS